MRYIVLMCLFLLFTKPSLGQCNGPVKARTRIQWSEAAKIFSPDRLWVVEVHPVLDADENQSPVTIRKCVDPKSRELFTLRRNAEVFWAPDSKHLMVIDQPVSGGNKLLLFPIPDSSTPKGTAAADDLDKSVMKVLLEKLPKNHKIQFYLPSMVAWKGDSVLLAVGGETYTGASGPLSDYCFGFRIDVNTLQLQTLLSKTELKAVSGRGCRVSP